jgi:glycosyltransferase involved in cell wall biosynthesis
MPSQPLVSVLMTAYNREKYIAEAIESVLASTYKNLELIVVDDGSTDKTVEIVRAFEKKDPRVKLYINEQNLGDYPNRNQAAKHARGKYIKYVDSDDHIYYYSLELMVKSMEQYPDAGFGLCVYPDLYKKCPVCLTPYEAYMEHFVHQTADFFHRAPGSAIIKRSAFEAVNGFSGKRMIGDNELWLKLGRSFNLVKLPRDLVWTRHHPGQESKSEYAKQYDQLRSQITKEAFEADNCPLSKEEIKRYYRERKKNKIKLIILNFFSFFYKGLKAFN